MLLFPGITLMVADKHSNTAETYMVQCETQAMTDVWMEYFTEIVGTGNCTTCSRVGGVIVQLAVGWVG